MTEVTKRLLEQEGIRKLVITGMVFFVQRAVVLQWA